MSTLIPRNTAIPIDKTKEYHTMHDNQTTVGIKILQGEAHLAADNHYVG